MRTLLKTILALALAASIGSAAAQAVAAAPAAASAPAAAPSAGLDERVQQAKSDVIKLNRDLLVLEEELLFPASTQVALFVSMDVGKLFALDSVQIKLNDKLVSNHLYTPLEVEALHRIQPVDGAHFLPTAFAVRRARCSRTRRRPSRMLSTLFA